MIRLKWNPAVLEEKRAARVASGLYMQAGMIPYVSGERRAIVGGDEGEAEYRFRPTAAERIVDSDFLEDEDDGQAERTG